MSDFIQRLKTEVLVGMGSYITNLVDKGYDMMESGHWWISNHPDQYQDLLKAFLNARADFVEVVLAHRLRLRTYGLEDKTLEINSKIAKISREVTPSDRYLVCAFATGQLLPPMGNATVDEIYEMYKEMVIIGLDAGVDLFHCACGGFGEAEIAMKVIKNNSKLPILATLSFNPTPKGFRTMEGIDPATGARKLEELGADVIGTQCGGIGYEEVTAVLREMGKACSKYLMAKPNSGIPQLINGKTVWPATPEEMAKAALNWVSAGARIISGCCGTTPEHIAKVVAVVK